MILEKIFIFAIITGNDDLKNVVTGSLDCDIYENDGTEINNAIVILMKYQ